MSAGSSEDGGPVLSEERLAEINRRRQNPLEDAVPHEEMVRMLEERRATEAVTESGGRNNVDDD